MKLILSFLIFFEGITAFASAPDISYLCVPSRNGQSRPETSWATVTVDGPIAYVSLGKGERYAIEIKHQSLNMGGEAVELNHFNFTAQNAAQPRVFSTVVEGAPRLVSFGYQIDGIERRSFSCNRN